MQWLSRITIFILLVVWLPATQHCAFATIANLETSECDAICDHNDSGDQLNACTLVESGDYTSASNLAHVPIPNPSAIVCLIRLHARLLSDPLPLAHPAWTKDDPSAWVPSWAFVARAALPARAPNLT